MEETAKLTLDPATKRVMLTLATQQLHELAMGLVTGLKLEATMVRDRLQADTLADFFEAISMRPGSTYHDQVDSILTKGDLLLEIVAFWLQNPQHYPLNTRDLNRLRLILEQLSSFYLWAGRKSFSAGLLFEELKKIQEPAIV
jgi:hypothetical protein